MPLASWRGTISILSQCGRPNRPGARNVPTRLAATLRARVKVGALPRQLLAQSGIDAAAVAVLPLCDEAEQQLATIADDPQMDAARVAGAGDACGEGLAASLCARLGRMAYGYRAVTRSILPGPRSPRCWPGAAPAPNDAAAARRQARGGAG